MKPVDSNMLRYVIEGLYTPIAIRVLLLYRDVLLQQGRSNRLDRRLQDRFQCCVLVNKPSLLVVTE